MCDSLAGKLLEPARGDYSLAPIGTETGRFPNAGGRYFLVSVVLPNFSRSTGRHELGKTGGFTTEAGWRSLAFDGGLER